MKTEPVLVVLIGLIAVSTMIGCAGTEQDRTGDQAMNKDSPETKQAQETAEFDLPPHHFIRRGMSTARITSLVGSPERKVQHSGRPDVWYYNFGLVMIQEKQVQYKYPPSRSGREQEGSALETGR